VPDPRTCTLQPDDLILTGTPSGVGMAQPPQFLQSGDVRIEIERLGTIEHSVV
jgi:acylpyruvate hydrolase